MLKYLVEKEFKQLLRNSFLPRMIIAYPLMLLLVFPLAMNFEVKQINLAVVDSDHSSYSSRLVRKIGSSDFIRITDSEQDYSRALKSVELDKSDIVLEIPEGFEKNIVSGQRADVMISANTVNGTKGGLGSAYLAGIVANFGSEIRAELMPAPSRLEVPALEVIPSYRYNPRLSYPVFMVPALMVMVLTILCGFLPALNIVGEKEKGTIEQMNVTPVRKFTLILSKLIPYWLVGFIVLTICFGVAGLVYRLAPAGHLSTIYIFSAIFVLAISGFGLVISNYARTVQQAMFMMFFFIITMIFMSGLYTQIASMPPWARMISNFSPLRYLMEVLRLVYLKGSGIAELRSHFLALCGFAIFFNGWAILSYRKTA